MYNESHNVTLKVTLVIKPNFLIIGTQKGGTSWLRNMLRQHPDVFMPVAELHFFDQPLNYEKGLAWYCEHFASVQGETAIGEKTPRYLLTDPEDPLAMPRRIHEALPDARLIAILRNPVERAISGINHQIRSGYLSPDTDLDSAIHRHIEEQANVIRFGYYAEHLEAYYRFYDPTRIKLLIYEDDIVAQPHQMLRAMCEFLTITPDFTFTDLEKSVNTGRISNLGIKAVHKLPVGNRTALKLMMAAEKALGHREAKKRPSPAVIDRLYDVYADPNEQLFNLIGREIPSWQKVNAHIT